jgi:hypothetical protein
LHESRSATQVAEIISFLGIAVEDEDVDFGWNFIIIDRFGSTKFVEEFQTLALTLVFWDKN